MYRSTDKVTHAIPHDCWLTLSFWFRYLCFKIKPLYVRVDRTVKAAFALELVNEMATLDPPGRFVELVEGTLVDDGRVVSVPPLQAIEKTCQALREKKNGCPRPFRTYDSSKGKKALGVDGPMFSESQIKALWKRLEHKFRNDLEPKPKKARSASRQVKGMDEDKDNDFVEQGITIKAEHGARDIDTPPKRLTARQAIIESMKDSKEPTLKRKEPTPVLSSSPLCPHKKPKVWCHRSVPCSSSHWFQPTARFPKVSSR